MKIATVAVLGRSSHLIFRCTPTACLIGSKLVECRTADMGGSLQS